MVPTRRLLGFLLCAPALAACQARVETHGFMPNPQLISQVEVGKQNKRQIGQLLGTPSTVATFDNDVWYYITQRTENYAFFQPEIVDQQVLAISFDDAGTVDNVHRYTLADGKIVDMVSRTTPTVGNELTFLEQLFGNVGRFTDKGSGAGGGGGDGGY
ncbi:MAG: cell envelope protein SmpA [Rhodospirillaceae bacterium]|nr:cell envelope protein SmpA [Rhodospirillaceae bacterium]